MLNHNYLWRMTEWGSIPWWRPRAPPLSHSCTDRPSPSWVPAHQTRHNTGRPSQMPELRWGRTTQCWGQNCLWPPPQQAHRHRPQVYFPPRGQSDQQWRGSGTAWTLPDCPGQHSSSSQGSDKMWGNVPAFFLLAQTAKMVFCQINKSSIQTFFLFKWKDTIYFLLFFCFTFSGPNLCGEHFCSFWLSLHTINAQCY